MARIIKNTKYNKNTIDVVINDTDRSKIETQSYGIHENTPTNTQIIIAGDDSTKLYNYEVRLDFNGTDYCSFNIMSPIEYGRAIWHGDGTNDVWEVIYKFLAAVAGPTYCSRDFKIPVIDLKSLGKDPALTYVSFLSLTEKSSAGQKVYKVYKYYRLQDTTWTDISDYRVAVYVNRFQVK